MKYVCIAAALLCMPSIACAEDNFRAEFTAELTAECVESLKDDALFKTSLLMMKAPAGFTKTYCGCISEGVGRDTSDEDFAILAETGELTPAIDATIDRYSDTCLEGV